MNFLLLRKWINDKPFMIVVENIIHFVPLDDKDGYGNPQKGTTLHFVDGSEIRVKESLQEIFEFLKRPIE